jgi:hypothetical protein
MLVIKCAFCMVIHHLEYLIALVFGIVTRMLYEEKICLPVLRY